VKKSDLQDAIALIDELVPNSRAGLPEALFLLVSRLTPLINVDLLIENEAGEKLLVWRHDRFYGPGWHIPGGIVRFKETMAERLAKVALSEVGCEATVIGECLRITEMRHVDRDVRGHFVSHLFRCRLSGEPDSKLRAMVDSPNAGEWAWFRSAPESLIQQHKRFSDLLNASPNVQESSRGN
jgi:colanic acid biosynthesis protein WcaH